MQFTEHLQKPKSLRSVLLNYKRFHPYLINLTTQDIYSMPYPTKKELDVITPFPRALTLHISHVLVTYPNIHIALLDLVPSVYSLESHFWARYLKRLYQFTKLSIPFSQQLISSFKTNHLFNLKSSLLPTEPISIGRVPLNSGGSFLANISHCHRYQLNHSDVLHEILQMTYHTDDLQKIRASWIQKVSITTIHSKLVYLLRTMHKLPDRITAVISDLLTILLNQYDVERAYLITQSFIIRIIYTGLFPFTTVQHDFLKLQIAKLISTQFVSLTKNFDQTLPMLQFLVDRFFLPMSNSLPPEKVLLLLGSVLHFGYPFLLRLLCNTLQALPNQNNDIFDFLLIQNVFTTYFDKLLVLTWDNSNINIPFHHYFLPLPQPVIESSNGVVKPSPRSFNSSFNNIPRPLDSLSPSVLPSDFITIEMARFLNSFLPLRISIMDLELIFNTKQDGFSLTQLYYQCASRSPLIFLIKAEKMYFGAYVSDALVLQQRYYGSGETFLFTLNPPRKYEATFKNSFFIQSDVLHLRFGGGSGESALAFDDSLNGSNFPTETFDNPLFTSNPLFKIQRMEVWSCTVPLSLPSSLSTSTGSSSLTTARDSFEGMR
ncbi:Oxidation resistance protein 1 [Entamoeba marina]